MAMTSERKPLHLVFAGSFGAAVAEVAAETLHATHEVSLLALSGPRAEPPHVMAEGETTVLITPRFDWREVHMFDAASHRANHRWCFVGYAYPYVLVGPYVSPHNGPCYSCLRVRLAQHGRTEIPLEGSHVPVPEGHIEGIPRHLVYSVAGLLAGLLSAAERAGPRSVHLLHANGLKVRSEALVGVHDCQRCAAPGNGSRRNRELLRVYRQLWEE